MIEGADSERNVAIVLQLAADKKNKSVSDEFKRTILDNEKFSVEAAKKSSTFRLEILEKEMTARNSIISRELDVASKAAKSQTQVFTDESKKRIEVQVAESAEINANIKAVGTARSRSEDEALRVTRDGAERRGVITNKETESIVRAQEKRTEKIKAAQHQHMEGNKKATESTVGVLQGVMDLTEGLAILGIAGDENFEAFARGFVKIQATFKALKGFTEIIWKGREALIAMEAAATGVSEANKLIATTGAIAIAAQTGQSIAGGAVSGRFGGGINGTGVAANVGVQAVGSAVGVRRFGGDVNGGGGLGGIAADVGGQAIGGYLGTKGLGGVKAVGGGLLKRAGGATLGGLAIGAAKGAIGGGKAVLGAGKAVGSILAGVSAGVLALGATVAGVLTETTGMIRAKISGGSFRGEGGGDGSASRGGSYWNAITSPSQWLNESPSGAVSGWWAARKQAQQSEKDVGKLEEKGKQQKEIRDRRFESENQGFTSSIESRDAQAGTRRRGILGGSGTDIEKSLKLERAARAELDHAKMQAAKELEAQEKNMYNSSGRNQELELAHMENVRKKSEDLLTVSEARLSLLKAQSKEHQDLVKTSKAELTVAQEKLKAAEETSRKDRESKLSSYDRLDRNKQKRLSQIKDKLSSGGSLNDRDVTDLEEARVGSKFTEKYRSDRAKQSGGSDVLSYFGEFNDSDKALSEAKSEEGKKRDKLSESIALEVKSRDAMSEQIKVVAERLAMLAESTDSVLRKQGEISGIPYVPSSPSGSTSSTAGSAPVAEKNPVVSALNAATDSGVQDTIAVVGAVQVMQQSYAENMRSIKEEIEQEEFSRRSYSRIG